MAWVEYNKDLVIGFEIWLGFFVSKACGAMSTTRICVQGTQLDIINIVELMDGGNSGNSG